MSLRVCDECNEAYWDPEKTRSRYFWHRCLECKIEIDWEILITEAVGKMEKTNSLHRKVLLAKTIGPEAGERYIARRLSE